MARYIARRVVYMVFVFFILSIILYFLFNLIPGDPVAAQLQPLMDEMTAEEYEIRYNQLRSQMGLDDPLIVRYARWVTGMLSGDLGQSHRYRRPVADVIVTPLRNTIFINIFAVAIGLAITIPLGILCCKEEFNFR